MNIETTLFHIISADLPSSNFICQQLRVFSGNLSELDTCSVALISGLLYCGLSPCSLRPFGSACGGGWSDVIRLMGLQCVNKRFIHWKIIWRYVTGLLKCAATKHLRSVFLIT